MIKPMKATQEDGVNGDRQVVDPDGPVDHVHGKSHHKVDQNEGKKLGAPALIDLYKIHRADDQEYYPYDERQVVRHVQVPVVIHVGRVHIEHKAGETGVDDKNRVD